MGGGAEDGPGTAAVRVAEAADVAEGESRKFRLRCGERELECFVIRHRGEIHAWLNECRHVPMSLDWVENQFFTAERDYLLCPTHGALYVPDTGECVAGPPCGKSLHRIPVVERDGGIWASCPAPLP